MTHVLFLESFEDFLIYIVTCMMSKQRFCFVIDHTNCIAVAFEGQPFVISSTRQYHDHVKATAFANMLNDMMMLSGTDMLNITATVRKHESEPTVPVPSVN